MCPACLATAALVVTGGTSAGGLTALIVKKLRRKRNRKNVQAQSKSKEEIIMTKNNIALPEIVSRDEWLTKRKELLKKEKELTRLRDELNAKRRKLPMVRIEKDYVFEGPEGEVLLLNLFDGRSPADRLPLHVRPGLGRGLQELGGRSRGRTLRPAGHNSGKTSTVPMGVPSFSGLA